VNGPSRNGCRMAARLCVLLIFGSQSSAAPGSGEVGTSCGPSTGHPIAQPDAEAEREPAQATAESCCRPTSQSSRLPNTQRSGSAHRVASAGQQMIEIQLRLP
jgi:hypothetical protein